MQGPSSHTSQRTVLVLGARGTVGSEVTRALLEAGARVRILTRSSNGLDHLPDTVERLVGDVRDSACLARAMEGVASAFYSSPHEEDEEQLARNVVEACETAGARLVFMGAHVDGPNRLVRALKRRAFGRLAPHYRPKFAIAERVRRSRAHPVLLMPSNFCQNDELFREHTAGGHLLPAAGPQGRQPGGRAGRGRRRGPGDARPVHPRGTAPGARARDLLGARVRGRVWSAALGREVRYTGGRRAVLDGARCASTSRAASRGLPQHLPDHLSLLRADRSPPRRTPHGRCSDGLPGAMGSTSATPSPAGAHDARKFSCITCHFAGSPR
jgi:uncharacterized protein YbjT (DUF2867 family)